MLVEGVGFARAFALVQLVEVVFFFLRSMDQQIQKRLFQRLGVLCVKCVQDLVLGGRHADVGLNDGRRTVVVRWWWRRWWGCGALALVFLNGRC